MKYIFLFAVIYSLHWSCTTTQQFRGESLQKEIVTAHKISDVWSGHPVGFDLLTADRYQYVAFYDKDQNMCIGQRKLGSEEWKIKILPSRVGWDSHNSIAIALDQRGHLHVSGNMHADPLVYFRASKPGDIESLEEEPMVGQQESRVTYPVFFKNQDGTLFYQYRDGGSGNGITYINKYDPRDKSWSRVLDQGLFDGEGETNAYPTRPLLGPDGYFHYMWVWRLTPVANTNHNLSYVKTRDFKTFINIRGEQIDIPIKYRERKVIADPVGPWNGLMNSSKILAFDAKNRVVFGYHKFDKEGHSQLFLCHYDDQQEVWINKQVSNWPDFTWSINKTGSLGRDIGLHAIEPDGQGNLFVSYTHVQYGKGLLKVDEDTFKLLEDLPDKKIIEVANLPDTPSPDMQIMQRWDNTGKYIMQWQTLGVNFDRPHEPPYPAPSALMIYKVQ